MTCYVGDCNWSANYWYITGSRRVGMCFGHATEATHIRWKGYGRRERKVTG